MSDFINLLDEMEITDVKDFTKWDTLWVWIFFKMTGMKIGLLYRRGK